MADVIITIKVMPESPEIDLTSLEGTIKQNLEEEECKVMQINTENVAFGLKALMVTFARDESKGDTEPVEQKISDIEGVNSVQVTDIKRAVS